MVCKIGTVQQIARRLHSEGYQVSEYALRRWIRDGVIPSVRSGKKFLVTYDRVVEYLESGIIMHANSVAVN